MSLHRDSPTDEELLSAFRLGRHDCFAVLVRRYERELYGFLVRFLGDADLAEDVFQNTFLQVFTKIEQYENGRPVRPWIYAIAQNQAIDALRRAKRRPTVPLDFSDGSGDRSDASLLDLLATTAGDPLGRLESIEQAELVRSWLLTLPDGLRETIHLAFFQELKYSDIAEILGIPIGTVKSRVHTAVKRLAEQAAALRWVDS